MSASFRCPIPCVTNVIDASYTPTVFTLGNTGQTTWVINGVLGCSNPTLRLTVGTTYMWRFPAAGLPFHPLWIKTIPGNGSANGVPGVLRNGNTTLDITWTPTAAGIFWYNCQTHPLMQGMIVVTQPQSVPGNPTGNVTYRFDSTAPTCATLSPAASGFAFCAPGFGYLVQCEGAQPVPIAYQCTNTACNPALGFTNCTQVPLFVGPRNNTCIALGPVSAVFTCFMPFPLQVPASSTVITAVVPAPTGTSASLVTPPTSATPMSTVVTPSPTRAPTPPTRASAFVAPALLATALALVAALAY